MLQKIYCVLLLLCIYCSVTLGQYTFPVIEFYATSPRGFRVELPDQPGVELFAFHGKINGPIDASKEGDINGEITSSSNGKWVFEDPSVELSIGDKVYYWAYVQHNRAGYALRNKQWEVTQYSTGGTCENPSTVASGVSKRFCAGDLIFEDDFNESNIDRNKWVIQQYIPSITEDDHFEFVSYQDKADNRFIRNSVLYLKPTPSLTRSAIVGILDLTQGCTRTKTTSCFYQQVGAYILPPVVSAKVLSTLAFRYGKIEIKAKVPIGDWIYPQIELIPKGKLPSYPKILLAYTRGNLNLTLSNGFDIGNTLLFGGPVEVPTEPERSEKLRSFRSTTPFGREMRTYTIEWSSSEIAFKIDSDKYGTVSSREYMDLTAEYQISLGVGVGGNYDFPDKVTSGGYVKPWSNMEPRIMKDFYDRGNLWQRTWIGDDVALQIDSVKVWAV